MLRIVTLTVLLVVLPVRASLSHTRASYPLQVTDVAIGAKVVESSPTYGGYGVENALDGDPFDDYTAGVEGILPQHFTIDFGTEVKVHSLELTWESEANFGTDYKISRCWGEDLVETLVERKGESGQHQKIHFAPPRTMRTLRMEVSRFFGHQRILLRQMKILASKQDTEGFLESPAPSIGMTTGTNFFPQRLGLPSTFSKADILKLSDKHTGERTSLECPVSIARMSETTLYVCNYHSIFFVDLREKTAFEVLPPPEVKVWVPTALSYSPSSNILYVANYTGKDALAFEVLPDHSLKLVRRFTHEKLKGPENLAASKDGKYVAIADYDGNAAYVYESDGTLVWSVPMLRAHGVAISSDSQNFFFSSLGESVLYKFDVEGNLIAKVGKAGWGRDSFLWPTTISISDSGLLAVSDAHTGKVTLLDDDLNDFSCIGGNGPGFTLFNMPYCAIWESDTSLLVADTYKDRLVRVTPQRGTIEKVYTLRKQSFGAPSETEPPGSGSASDLSHDIAASSVQLDTEDISFSSFQRPVGISYDRYVNNGKYVQLRLPMSGVKTPDEWRLAYNRLVSRDGYDASLLHSDNLFSFGAYFYFMLASNYEYMGENFTILGSPQCPTWLVIRQGVAVPIYLQNNLWQVGDYLVNESTLIPIHQIVKAASRLMDLFIEQAASTQDILECIRTTFFSTFTQDQFRERFLSTFRSKEGRALARVCLSTRDQTKIRKAAAAYFASEADGKKILLAEYFLARLILCDTSTRQTVPLPDVTVDRQGTKGAKSYP